RVVPLIGSAGVRGLNPGHDVAGRLHRIPKVVGANPRRQGQAEDIGWSRRIVREPAEQKVAQLVTPEGPGRKLIRGRMKWIALGEVRVGSLERKARDDVRHEKVEGRATGALVGGVSEGPMGAPRADLEDKWVRGWRVEVSLVRVVAPRSGEFA